MDPQELSGTLRAAARTAREINLRAFEQQSSPEVVSELVPKVHQAIQTGVDALTLVLHHYEAASPASPSEVADLSFVARLELLAHQQQLQGLSHENDAFKIVSECGSGRRSVLRGTFAVDRALCAREGLAFDATDLGLSELEQSLRVRAGYARFRRDLLALGPPELADISAFLEGASRSLVAMVQAELFDDLRLDDRLQMHRLAARLRAWLDGVDGRDPRSGLRLAQDLGGFVSLLVQVNHRTELVEHDRAVVGEVYDKLFGPKARTSVPPELLAKLEKLYGRDDGIDGLLDAGLGQFAVEWREPLERLRVNLGLGAEAESLPVPLPGGAEEF